ncbi:hypothetical protein [Roseivivax sp. CAU 1753]
MAKILVSAISVAAIVAGFGSGYAIASLSEVDGADLEIADTSSAALDPKQPPKHQPEKPAQEKQSALDEVEPFWMNDRLVFLGRITVPVERPWGTSYVVTDLAIAMSNARDALALKSPDKALRMRDTALLELRSAASSRMLRDEPMDTTGLSTQLKAALEEHVGAIDEMLLLSFYVAEVPRT